MRIRATAITLVKRQGANRRAVLAALAVFLLATAPRYAAAEDLNDSFRKVGGLVVYFAAVPAAFVLEHPAEHTGREMHGGAPSGRYVHHLIVAAFDATTNSRITDASVSAVVKRYRETQEQRIELEPMTIRGAQAYGGFATLAPRAPYSIEIEIRRPGKAAVQASFSHRHLQP